MKAEARKTLIAYLIELVIYAVLIAAYFMLVLHLLGPSLADIKNKHVTRYAFLCVGLILGQSIILEWITTKLIRFLRGRSQ